MSKRGELEKLTSELLERLFDVDYASESMSDSDEDVTEQVEESELSKMVNEPLNPSVQKQRIKFESVSDEIRYFIIEKKRTPNLDLLYKALLSIPPTSVECERLFSHCGHILSKKRNRMSDKSLDSIIFLKHFYLNLEKSKAKK